MQRRSRESGEGTCHRAGAQGLAALILECALLTSQSSVSTDPHMSTLSPPGSSAYSPPDAFKISIPIRNNYMYARVRKALPELYAFTVCVWLRSRSDGTGQGTPFSYSVPGQANEIVLLEAGHEPMELLINDKVSGARQSRRDRGPGTPFGSSCTVLGPKHVGPFSSARCCEYT